MLALCTQCMSASSSHFRPFIVTAAPLAIISNHLSTRNQADSAWDGWLSGMVADHPWVTRYVIDDISDIPRILKDCAASGTEMVAVDGGDGTAGLVFSGLLNDGPFVTPPALALLPSGKTNMTAEAWSLRGDRRTALAALLRRHVNGKAKAAIHTHPVLTVTDGDLPPRHGAFFGGADVVDGILYCRKHIYPLGWPNTLSHSAAMALLMWRAMTSGFRGDNVGGAVEVRGTEEDAQGWNENGHFYVVMATTMTTMLLGVQPKPALGAGPINYMSLRPGALPILSTVPGMVLRRIKASQKRTVRRTSSVSFAFDGSYTLDGELYATRADTPVHVDGRQSLRFVRW